MLFSVQTLIDEYMDQILTVNPMPHQIEVSLSEKMDLEDVRPKATDLDGM